MSNQNKKRRLNVGIDEFHGYLSTIFPDGSGNGSGSDIHCASAGSATGSNGIVKQRNKNMKKKSACKRSQQPAVMSGVVDDNDDVSVSATADAVSAGSTSSIRPDTVNVKFTKNAVELLRETYFTYLRQVGIELSQHDSINDNPELLIRALTLPDTSNAADDEDDDEIDNDNDNDNEVVSDDDNNTSNSNSYNENPTKLMEQIVNEAQNLLVLQQQQRKEQKQRREKAMKDENSNKNKNDNNNNKKKSKTEDSMMESTITNNNTSMKTANTYQNQTRNKEEEEVQRPSQNKKRKKKKMKKLIITAEMEVEQERLLNQSKKALSQSQESSQITTVTISTSLHHQQQQQKQE